MRGFSKRPDGSIVALMHADEARLLHDLAAQVADLLEHADGSDPVMQRLLPDAYPDDAEASGEFRRFTSSGLLERKVANANQLMGTVAAIGDRGELTLAADEAVRWLTTLTDIRLALASRLGIESDDQQSDDAVLQNLYDWLGFVQNALVEALDS